MDFVQRLALDPLLKIPEGSQERSDVLSLRDRVYETSSSTIPQQSAGPVGGTQAKRRRGDGITMRRMTRPCSPTLFTGVKSREEPNDPQADLGETLGLIHKQKFPAQPVDINGPSLKLRTSTLLTSSRYRGKSSSSGRGRSLDVRLAGIQHHNSLGRLVSPLYRPSVEEQWAPREIAIFEAGICAYGKNFHAIQKMIRSKTTCEVIDFYYVWKKTDSYKVWKRSYHDE
ncbi:Mesoderm induction early response protein 1 [Hondaea fermentalgiana]|uniref:Mesoderm induction early response protein 1 n=1 Tax=Hondaea fermentalgiana TaxID=2315210 RepID=A0A2R5GZF7_9STRA|nr:Mesoderm induction early response protein 1 [Hondaea fermentalgiana]|eukprot:GBG33861.1 Mesoderm induction early response protein 1 [Hondaea fermentalgiana]